MADALEMALKEAVKKVIAEALAETLREKGALGASVPVAPVVPQPVMRKKAIARAKYSYICQSLRNTACMVMATGFLAAALFAPELARAAVGEAYEADPAPRHAVYQSVQVADEMPEGCQVTQPQSINWRDLTNFSKIEEMVKSGAVLHARPEDLVAIVIFHQLRKMIHGESIRLNHLEEDFKESLPCQWMPVYDAVKAEFPTQMPLPPIPRPFLPPAHAR